MKRTHSGGCHCGAVRYEADIDLGEGTLRCNCSICSKGRAWVVIVDAPDFHLLTGAEALIEYQFADRRIHHLFCRTCGIKSFGRAATPEGKEMFAVAVSCLDDVTDAELAALPIAYLDGRGDNFAAPPAETRHL